MNTGWTIFIDFDGTMTRSISAWKKYHEYFDTLVGMRANSKLFHESGNMGVNEWAEMDSGLWKGEKFPMPVHPDIDFVMLDNLDRLADIKIKWNIKLFVVSGSIHQLIENSLARTSSQFNRWTDWRLMEGMSEAQPLIDGIYAHHLKFDEDYRIEGIDYGEDDEWKFTSKRQMIDRLMTDRPDVNLTKIIAVGNGSNDIGMFKLVKENKGHTIAVNPRNPKLTELADQVVYTNDFIDVVKAIDGFLLSQEQF